MLLRLVLQVDNTNRKTQKMPGAQYWIQNLNMNKHPEGGYFFENYRSPIEIYSNALPDNFSENRNLATSIFYLLESGDISKFHAIQSDEMWYYHAGSPLTIAMLFSNGKFEEKILGPEVDKNQHLQLLVPAKTIFGAYLTSENSYCLTGCMVSPGFDFTDLKIFKKGELKVMFPYKQSEDIIEKLGF